MTACQLRTLTARTARTLAIAASFPTVAFAQRGSTPGMTMDTAQMAGMADHAMSGAMDVNMMKHMHLSAPRTPTHADSIRALQIADTLRNAVAKYQDTSAAVADGFHMFAPNVKNQRVYHFTNYRNAIMEAFRFDPAKPTSLLYTRDSSGKFHLAGAMYTMPKRASESALDKRVPVSIARWHQHVNWCLPKRGEQTRFSEKKNGAPVFGPESPIATKAECDAAGGVFLAHPLGWMVHANVFAGHDIASVWGDDDHGGGAHDHHM